MVWIGWTLPPYPSVGTRKNVERRQITVFRRVPLLGQFLIDGTEAIRYRNTLIGANRAADSLISILNYGRPLVIGALPTFPPNLSP